jgi:hypothetical protein
MSGLPAKEAHQDGLRSLGLNCLPEIDPDNRIPGQLARPRQKSGGDAQAAPGSGPRIGSSRAPPHRELPMRGRTTSMVDESASTQSSDYDSNTSDSEAEACGTSCDRSQGS